jgi:hypothetical protein
VPASGNYDDGEICGMMIDRETEILGKNLPQCRGYILVAVLNCNGFAQSIKLWSQKTSLLSKHVPTNTRNQQ